MLLTIKQLNEIKEIIRKHHHAFIANVIGEGALPADVVKKLKADGLVTGKIKTIEDAYVFGQIQTALGTATAQGMSYDQFKEYVAKNPVPLSNQEREAVNFAAFSAAQYCQGLGNRVDVATGQMLIEADQQLRNRMQTDIRTQTAANIARRGSIAQLKSELGHATKDWARDWGRIAVTETHNAMENGAKDAFKKQHGDPMVAKIPMPDACPHCLRLHLGPDGQPRIFKLSTLEANGTNYGLKTSQWKAVVGTVHPHCFVAGTKVVTEFGEVPIEVVRPGTRVLAANGLWEPVTHVWATAYRGDIVRTTTQAGVLDMTPNHPVLTSSGWLLAEALNEGDDISGLSGEIPSPVAFDAVEAPSVAGKYGHLASILHGFTRAGVPVTAIDFHSHLYIREGYVDEAFFQEVARGGVESSESKGVVDPAFIGRFEFSSLPNNGFDDKVVGLLLTPQGGVKGGDVGAPLFWRKLSHPDALAFRSIPWTPSSAFDAVRDSVPRDPQDPGYFLHGKQVVEVHLEDGVSVYLAPVRSSLPGHNPSYIYEAHCIVNVDRYPYEGVVYNLSVAGSESYVANGHVVHNCQCRLIRIPAGFGFDEEGKLVPGGEYGQVYEDGEDVEKALREEDMLRKAFQLKARIMFQGIPISIETPAGTYRKWRDHDGREGQNFMPYAYGFVEDTVSADEDEFDVFIGPNPRSGRVFIIHQAKPSSGIYDEDKAMLGFDTEAQAVSAYLASYDKMGPVMLQGVSETTVDGFRRLLQHHDEDGSHRGMLKKSEVVFILPLSKAVGSQSIAKETATATSRAGDRSPSPGTSANYVFNVPNKTPADPDHGGYRDSVMEIDEEEEAHDLAVNRKYLDDIQFRDPFPREPRPVVRPSHAGAVERDKGAQESLRLYIDNKQQLNRPQGAKNRAEIGGEKALSKGVTPIGGITPGGNRKVAEGVYVPLTGPKKKRHMGYEVVDPKKLKRPKVHDQFMQRGSKVSVIGKGKGVLLGYDWKGQPSVRMENGEKKSVHWKEVINLSPGQEYKSVLDSIPKRGKVIKPTAKQKALTHKAIQGDMGGGKTAKDYMDWFRLRGNEVFLVGGLVRDLLAGTARGVSDKAILQSMKDVDIITTSHAGAAHQAVNTLGGTNVYDASKWGVMRVLDGDGLDIAMISSEDGEPFTKGEVIGDHDIGEDTERRDFCCNALSYDVYNDVIIDPTGKGISDAQNKILRLAAPPEKAARNSILPLRFWKFRLRGYTTDPTDPLTLPLMKKLLPMALDEEVMKGLAKFMRKGKTNASEWKKLEEVMKADGAGDLYDKHIKPHRSAFVPAYLEKS